jgi:hypothetical protein
MSNLELPMTQKEFFCLTIALWPHAVKASVSPVKTDGFESGPQFYREHEFCFAHPPTRQDFWQLCAQTPWMSVFQENRKALIDDNPWPLVGPGKKARDVDVRDSQGHIVGRLSVRKRSCCLNSCPNIPQIGVDVWDRCVRGLKGELQHNARLWVMTNEHQIQEAAMAENKPITRQLLVKIGKRLLRQAGEL